MSKLDVYNLGQLGINRVKSPIQVQDGELLQSQNASVRPVQGQLALSKRDGMVVINEEVANGTLSAIINIPRRSIGGTAHCVVTPEIPAGEWTHGVWSPELGLFVVLQFSGSGIITSPDGITWTERTSPSSTSWQSIVWAAEQNKFVAVGPGSSAATQVMTSSDGITWVNRTAATNRTWKAVGYSPDLNLFVASAGTGSTAGLFMSSPDGITWTTRTGTRPINTFQWSSSLGLFVGAGEVSAQTGNISTSSNGTTWTAQTTPVVSLFNDMAYSEELGMFVTTGASSLPPYVSGSFYSTNGTTWTASDMPALVTSAALSGIDWSPELGVFLIATGNEISYISQNGMNWTPLASNCGVVNYTNVIWSPELEKFLLIGQDDSTAEPVFELLSES